MFPYFLVSRCLARPSIHINCVKNVLAKSALNFCAHFAEHMKNVHHMPFNRSRIHYTLN